MDEAAARLQPLLLERAHQHVEDVVAEEAARIARRRGGDAIRVQRGHDCVDGQRRRIGERAVRINGRAGPRRGVVVGRRRLVEVVREALHGDAGAAVSLAEADYDVGLCFADRSAQFVGRAGVADGQQRLRDVAVESIDKLLRRIDG